MRKIYILAITFFCLLMGNLSYGQLTSGDSSEPSDKTLYDYDPATDSYDPIPGADLETYSVDGINYAKDDTGNVYKDINNDGHFDTNEAVEYVPEEGSEGSTKTPPNTNTNTSQDTGTNVEPENNSSSSFSSWGGSIRSQDSTDSTDSNDNTSTQDFGGGGNQISFLDTKPTTETPWDTTSDESGTFIEIVSPKNKNWYIDRDGDGFDSETKTQETKPDGYGWIEGTSRGTDCDDEVWSYDNKNCAAKKTWYLDADADGWHSQTQQAELSPGKEWTDTTLGIDCNDSKKSLTDDCSVADPCAEIKNTLNYKTRFNYNLKEALGSLKTLVNSDSNEKEEGFEISKLMNYDQTFRYEFGHVIKGEKYSVGLQTGGGIIGTFHSHPSDGVPMFSFQDLRHLLALHDGALAAKKNDVFEGVVVKDAEGNVNVYMLKVDDIAKLRTIVDDTWKDKKYARYKTDEKRIEAIHKDQGIKFKDSDGKIEKSFLEQFPAAGISLYKVNADVSSASKLTLDDKKEVTSTDCD